VVGKKDEDDPGLDDLFEGVVDKDKEAEETKPAVVVSKKIVKDGVEKYSNRDAKKNKIQVWSPEIQIALWCLKEIVPKFSISGQCRDYILEGLMRDHPDLMKKIDEERKRKHDFK
jgi:hypothetical protein